ncbi:ribosome silencing factor [Rhodococcus tukisamuensis]|uniref:Ribosomal silencing factor RsfS n=1 Tax=Rhodococcus tukisamuensis TaxID=168276 RepID=A0A1G7D0Y4_9NOCA|nr:ribosome silencing factor [Rhodococcus tukisamuensis]SDE44690.1 ribosome-associated protein [Rhodococcus tukisamuensis]
MSASAEATEMSRIAALAADEKLATEVVVLDVSEQLVITDCFVIASASNERQVNSIVDNVEEKLREAGHKPVRKEGTREGRWALLDYIDMVVHIQHSDEREFYGLERLWKDCPVVPVEGIEATPRPAVDDEENANLNDRDEPTQ